MWRVHLFNLLKRAASHTFPFGGSNLVGALFIGVFGLAAGFAFTVLIEWWRGGRTMSSLRTALKSWPPWAGGILGAIFCWLLLFFFQIGAGIYGDHQMMVVATQELNTENTRLKGKLSGAEETAEQQCEQAKGGEIQAKDKEINRLKTQRNAVCFNPDRKLTKMEEEELFSDLKRIRIGMEKQHQAPVYRMYSFGRDRESGSFALEQLMPIFKNAGWTIKVPSYSEIAEAEKAFDEQQKWMFDHGLYEGVFVFDKNWPKGFGVQVGLALSKVDLTDWMQSNQELTKQLPHLEDLTIWVGFKHTTREQSRPIR